MASAGLAFLLSFGANLTSNLSSGSQSASLKIGLRSKMENSRAGTTANLSRWALGVAALLAAGAIGVKMWQGQSSAAPAAEAPVSAEEVGVLITQLESHLKKNPNDVEGWMRLGWSLYGTQKYAESALAYRRATQLAPDKAEGWSALGEALVVSGEGKVTPDAQSAFAKALAIDPTDARARYFAALSKEQAGDHAAALDGFFALLKDSPADAPWAENVRKSIADIGKAAKIDVSARLAALQPAEPGRGAERAAAAIPGPSTGQMRDAVAMPKGQQDAMIQSMVDGLEAKLKTNPKQLDRWIMLMRSRAQLGESVKAARALADARAAFAGDAAALSQLNDAAELLGVH
jgi:cytochrome c-type biogenesis protein CcmH